MPATMPDAGANQLATVERTALAGSKLCLFKSGFVPSRASTAAQFIAQEADYSGYTAGGVTITNWTTPLIDPEGGWSMQSGLIQFAVTDPDPDPIVPNTIGGWFVLTAAGALVIYGTFDQTVPMQVVGNGIPMAVEMAFGPSLAG